MHLNNLIKLLPIFFLFLILFFYSCVDGSGELTLGEEFIESQTDLNLIDTFSIKLSTVVLDTIITSGSGKILVGNYQDDISGKISCNSYFQVGVPESFNVMNDDTYDSLNLVIRYNNYSFGDTTRFQKISVHQLTEKIEPDDNGNINSKTTFNYNPIPLGTIIYKPEPNNPNDTLYIKISDDVGLDLFNKLKNNSDILTNNERFINYFHGLVLTTDESYQGSIIGFNTYDAGLFLYTTGVSETIETIKHEFILVDSAKQFNHITHNFGSTRLRSLVEQRNELPSSETGGLSYLQGGIGLAIRIDFPSLQEILLFERGKITEAQLSIAPVKNIYNDYDLPQKLTIYKTDKLNRVNGYSYAASALTKDQLYNEETFYSFDLTNYIIEELSDFYVDPESGILILLPNDDMSVSFCRMITDAQNQNLKLKIYYLTY